MCPFTAVAVTLIDWLPLMASRTSSMVWAVERLMSAVLPLPSVMRIEPRTNPCPPPIALKAALRSTRSPKRIVNEPLPKRCGVRGEARTEHLLALRHPQGSVFVASDGGIAGHGGRQGVRIAAGGGALLSRSLSLPRLVGGDFDRIEQAASVVSAVFLVVIASVFVLSMSRGLAARR